MRPVQIIQTVVEVKVAIPSVLLVCVCASFKFPMMKTGMAKRLVKAIEHQDVGG
jgi:hypothetical protein